MLAVQASLLKTLGGSVARGTFLNSATEHYPAVVLGAVAAQSLGIDRVPAGTQVDLGGRYFTVVGILRSIPLAPEIDQSAMVGFPVANSLLGLGAIRPRSTCVWIPIRCRQLGMCCLSLRIQLSQEQFR